MNKKGFTLVELIAVIALLAVIIGFSVPAIMNKINLRQGEIDKALFDTVSASANLYVNNNKAKYNDKNTHYIKFSTLVNEDLLDQSVLDKYPNYCVKLKYESNRFTNSVVTDCEEG